MVTFPINSLIPKRNHKTIPSHAHCLSSEKQSHCKLVCLFLLFFKAIRKFMLYNKFGWHQGKLLQGQNHLGVSIFFEKKCDTCPPRASIFVLKMKGSRGWQEGGGEGKGDMGTPICRLISSACIMTHFFTQILHPMTLFFTTVHTQ